MKNYGFALVAVALAGCASMVEAPVMPSNFTAKAGDYGKQYVDKARFEYPAPNVESFTERVARCGVTNLRAGAFQAKSSSTWVGPATGALYKVGSTREISAEDVVKHVGESENIVVLTGRQTYGDATALQIALVGEDTFKEELQFDIEAKLEGEAYSLTFLNIQRAFHESSMAENRGFMPIGIWGGSKADDIVPIIEAAADRLNGCINS